MGVMAWSTPFSGVAVAAAANLQPAPTGESSFTPKLAAGQSMTYEAEWTVSASQSTTEGSALTRQAQRIANKATIQLTIQEVASDGQAKVKATVPAVSMLYHAGEETREYQHPLAEGTAVTATAWSGLGERLATMEIGFVVDAQGKVGAVSGLDPFVNACREASPDLDLTGLFTPSQFAAFVQPIFDADGSRGTTHPVGTSWETSQTTPLGAVGVLDITNLWRFPTIDGDVATVVGTPTLSLRRPANPAENTPTIALGANTGYTRLGWNVKAEKLEARESMLRMTTTFGVGDISIEHTQTVQTKLVAKG